MKQRLIKMYRFGRECISDGVINAEKMEDQIISLSDSFLLFAWECYRNEKLVDGQLITELIKVMLPASEEAAKIEWENGLTFNGQKYYAWFATTGGMKKEDSGKCETIFIREDCRTFAEEFEDLISLGKFKEIEESKKKICINKDILSRISLGVSSSFIAGDMPDLIVLPQPRFKIVKDYKTVEKYTKEVDGKTLVDYELVDYHFDDEIDVFDGGAIATPNVFSQIQESLKLNYPVEFAIIRGYGIGIKGMITKFDIIGYLDEIYKEDTEYCRKVNGEYQLLDMWKQWQTVTDNTILLNESMVKLAKYYDSTKGENMSTYKERLATVDPKYKDIIGKLYVTKVNKRESDIEDYRRTNYQLINALALSKADYFELIKDEVRSYKKILKPFNKASDKDEWLINIDAIRLFFRNIIKGEYEDTESEEFQEEVKRISQNVVTKCEELLHISEDFVKLKFVKNNLARMIEKKCREIASGKFTVKAKYQYIAVCPISYMNFAMFRDQCENGLQAGQFYSADCNDRDIRTISRNPLCAYSEVHNVSFVRNDEFDKWFSPCRELIYFNQKSDILALMSSADTDGDACTVIDNEIIRNAVVVPKDGKYFFNKDDGHKEEMEFNSENRFLATYRASGNLIGKISLKAANINSDSQKTLDYYDVANNQFILFNSLDIEDKEERQAYIDVKLESGDWLTTYKASEQHREYIRRRFYENEKDIYIVLYNAMVSIDAPKTLYFPSADDMKVIDKKYPRKAWFLQYRENKEDVVLNQYTYQSGLLDIFTKEIRTQLLDVIGKIQRKFDNRADIIQQKLINGDYNTEDYPSCIEAVESLYSSYTSDRELANKQYLSEKKKLDKKKREDMNRYGWDEFREQEYQADVKKIKDERYTKYKEIDVEYIVSADKIIDKYDLATIANAIGNMKNCTEAFIINLFYPVFEYLNQKLQSNRWVYKKDEDGDIRFLGERYDKIPIGFVDNRDIVKKHHIDEKKRLKVISVKADIRARVLDKEAISTIQSELKNQNYIVFDIKVNDNKVVLSREDKGLLEVFNEFLQINQYNLLNCSSVKFELLADIAKSKKSVKLIATEITV
ncbi:hypothetical protein [Aneurinibacillus aneurinilyticus]|jgi:hypothetical protein|uniref:hypothetical protein n=1 Tax=Aneurinibacillus aneurinilyticus TaxID=1391 RepID=UPI0023F81DE4|nr:hypothetical protein [Aneurinibacillus aneurinilyticus]MCI1693286.1 hypothetical protein [Aneurinibacillus aneurinilyticus]